MDDKKIKQVSYQVGDIVLQRNDATKKGHIRKLKPCWKGPFLIIKVTTPVLFKVLHKKKASVLHHDSLKKCYDSVMQYWLKQARDNLEQGKEIQIEHEDYHEAEDCLESQIFFGKNLFLVCGRLLSFLSLIVKRLLSDHLQMQEFRLEHKMNHPVTVIQWNRCVADPKVRLKQLLHNCNILRFNVIIQIVENGGKLRRHLLI